jgi:uncharacterized protein (UPF0332 family)
MSTWMEMATEARDAAGMCLRMRWYRSSASRAYYAIFSAVMAALHNAGARPTPDRHTWPHSKLPDLARDHLKKRFGHKGVQELRRLMRETYKARIGADYADGAGIDAHTARRCLAAATVVIRRCEETL